LGEGGVSRASNLGDALLRVAGQADRGGRGGAGRRGGAPRRAGAAPARGRARAGAGPQDVRARDRAPLQGGALTPAPHRASCRADPRGTGEVVAAALVYTSIISR